MFVLFSYKIIQISPPEPSLIMRVSVSCSFFWASSGILPSLPRRPSFTSSCSDFPKMLDCHIFFGSVSNSLSRYDTSSSDCFSEPTIGLTSVSMSARIICITRYKPKFLIGIHCMMCILSYFPTNCKASLFNNKILFRKFKVAN